MTFKARSLHYVFRVANRSESYKFYTETLGMKILRHEEFREPCKASCNGPFDGCWSKTMVGYGSEDEHFVLELTYNYGVHSYEMGNDFGGIQIESDELLKRVQGMGHQKGVDGRAVVKDPDGHPFFIVARTKASQTDAPVTRCILNFWSALLGMGVVSASSADQCLLSYGPNQCALELKSLPKGVSLERKTAFGRIAFVTPTENLKGLEQKVREAAGGEQYIQSSLVSLDTPGKATVWVVILRDPNEHEICFVGDEGFRELSKTDPEADKLLRDAMEKDDS